MYPHRPCRMRPTQNVLWRGSVAFVRCRSLEMGSFPCPYALPSSMAFSPRFCRLAQPTSTSFHHIQATLSATKPLIRRVCKVFGCSGPLAIASLFAGSNSTQVFDCGTHLLAILYTSLTRPPSVPTAYVLANRLELVYNTS